MPLSLGSDKITFTDNTSLSSGIITSAQLSAGAVQQSFANTSGTFNFRNKIINGDFGTWQRGVTAIGPITIAPPKRFLADRWAVGGSATTVTISRQTFSNGQTQVPGNPIYFHRTVVTAQPSQSNFNYCILQQAIENVRTLADKTVTVSFWAKADLNRPIIVELIQLLATPATQTGGQVKQINLTNTWQKYTFTANIPSLAGQTIVENENGLVLNFWFNAESAWYSRIGTFANQSGTFDIAQVQVEEGSVETPFEQRPIGLELLLCQRYYQRGHWMSTVRVANSTVPTTPHVLLPTPMRAIPAITLTETAINPTGGAWNARQINVHNWEVPASEITGLYQGPGSSINGFGLQLQTAGADGEMIRCYWAADAEI